MVFRPAGFAFPLSRGRLALDLRRDGSAITTEPGPSDRPRAERGRWSLRDVDLCVETPPPKSRRRTFEIVSLTPERLVVRRK